MLSSRRLGAAHVGALPKPCTHDTAARRVSNGFPDPPCRASFQQSFENALNVAAFANQYGNAIVELNRFAVVG
jgi:hypothetical protein